MKRLHVAKQYGSRRLRLQRAHTLIELLISTGLLVLLGTGLAALLAQSLGLWRTASRRERVYESARVLLDVLAEDLRSAVVPGEVVDDDPWVRFVGDFVARAPGGGTAPSEADALPAARLRLVRTISGELADPFLRPAARLPRTLNSTAFEGRLGTSKGESLLAPAGRMEVLWLHEPGPGRDRVWRGVRTPIGGLGSLFVDSNAQKPLAAPVDIPLGKSRRGGGGRGTLEGTPRLGANRTATVREPETSTRPRWLESVARRVLRLEFRFWGPTTNTWRDVPPLSPSNSNRPSRKRPSGPHRVWPPVATAPSRGVGERQRLRVAGRDASPLVAERDFGFPRAIEIQLVLEASRNALGPRLAKDVGAKSTVLELTRRLEDIPDEEFSVRIEQEWIRIARVESNRLHVASNGRGSGGTVASRHTLGAEVLAGIEFRRVVELPWGTARFGPSSSHGISAGRGASPSPRGDPRSRNRLRGGRR